MREEQKFPAIVTEWDVRFDISFALGQMPRSLIVAWAGKDMLKREAARERMTEIIAERFKGYRIYKGAPLGPHNGSASQRES